MNKLRDDIDIALGRDFAPLVLKNASIINVFTQEIEKADIAINEDKIVGIGKYHGKYEIDCTDKFAAPGFIDAHVHVESSMVTPEVFSHLILTHGVTTAVADPHEIGNVLGSSGIKFMLENNKKSVMDIYFMLPSCVPATDFEDSGSELNAEELESLSKEAMVLGLGEVMDVNAVVNGREDMLKKLQLFYDKNIDGHCPSISERNLNAYLSCNIKTDHECSTYEEAYEKVKRGMYVMLREGSATKNLKTLLPAVNDNNYSRFLFCTDDRHIEDLMEEGTIDNSVRIAIANGLNPLKAYTIASLNAAQCYGLKDRGAIAPGYKADIIVFEDLEKLKIKNVIKAGKTYKSEVKFSPSSSSNSINMKPIDESTLKIAYKEGNINTIALIPHSVETLHNKRKSEVKDNEIVGIHCEDYLKIAVFERHKCTGKKSLGFVEGFGLKNCSIAQSIAHDSHNIIAVGDKDKDMALAVNTIIKIGGGIVFVANGTVLEALKLPIGGLITSDNPYIVRSKLKHLSYLAKTHGVKEEFDAFLTLGFLALPVIPKIKLTARGLFDYDSFKFIDLFD